jgi:hypothetical protein
VCSRLIRPAIEGLLPHGHGFLLHRYRYPWQRYRDERTHHRHHTADVEGEPDAVGHGDRQDVTGQPARARVRDGQYGRLPNVPMNVAVIANAVTRLRLRNSRNRISGPAVRDSITANATSSKTPSTALTTIGVANHPDAVNPGSAG